MELTMEVSTEPTKTARAVTKTPVTCPVCASKNYAVIFEPWQSITDPKALYGAASGVRGTQRIVKCADCTMIYENPRFSEEIILSGYASSDEAGHDSQYPMRVQSFYRALQRLGPYIPKSPARALDIGTAGGAFLDAAKKYGYDAVGLEPSEFLTEQGVKRGLNIRCGTIENHPFQKAEFDVISMWDVIEHVVDPKKSLLKIRPLLKEKGRLIINFPDIGTMQAKFAGKRFWWILSGHLHYFTRETMAKLLEDCGYEVVTFRKYWQTLEFGYLEEIAQKLKVPLAGTIKNFTPQAIQKIPMSYYASQTSAIAVPR
jgi:SAM-dependent methyltransferase